MSETAHYCSHCGAPLEPGAHFCGSCGMALDSHKKQTSLPDKPDKSSKSSFWKYLLLAIFILSLVGTVVTFVYLNGSETYDSPESEVSSSATSTLPVKTQEPTEKAKKIDNNNDILTPASEEESIDDLYKLLD